MMNDLIAKEADLGLDIYPIYQASCFSSSFPRFLDIYEEYKIEVILKESNLTPDYIKGQLDLINKGIYEPFELGLPTIEVRPEPEVLNYLLQRGYSFSFNKDVFNQPLREVW